MLKNSKSVALMCLCALETFCLHTHLGLSITKYDWVLCTRNDQSDQEKIHINALLLSGNYSFWCCLNLIWSNECAFTGGTRFLHFMMHFFVEKYYQWAIFIRFKWCCSSYCPFLCANGYFKKKQKKQSVWTINIKIGLDIDQVFFNLDRPWKLSSWGVLARWMDLAVKFLPLQAHYITIWSNG